MDSYVSVELLLVWLLLISTVVATFFVQRHRIAWLPPAAAAMLLGVAAGVVVRLSGLAAPLRFSPSAFFYGLLPPIVFAAGVTLKKRSFFANIGTVLLFAVAGTAVSTLVFGLATYCLVLLRVVKRKHLGPQPLIECMLFGALMSATDTVATLAVFSHLEVPPLLHNLVFGESVLNDAVAIVLFRTLVEFYDSPLSAVTPLAVAARFGVVLAGSTAAGVAVALACAFVLKRFELAPEAGGGWAAQLEFEQQQQQQQRRAAAAAESSANGGGLLAEEQEDLPTPARNPRRHPTSANGGLSFSGPETYEMCLVCLGAYLSYLVAEAVGLSGIVALFSAGVAHAHYSLNSCSPDARIALRRCFETAAFLCETFVFAYLGLQVPSIFTRTVDWGLLLTVVPLCVASRAAAVLPLARAANARRALPLPSGVVSALAACGLRGAVAYGLAVNLPAIKGESRRGIPAIEAATLVAVVASTLAAAPGADALLRRWGLLGASDDDLLRRALEETRGMSPAAAAEALAAAKARGDDADKLLFAWGQLDSRVLKPLFGGKVNSAATALGGILFRGGPVGGGGGTAGVGGRGGGGDEEEEESESEPLARARASFPQQQPAAAAAAAATTAAAAAAASDASPLLFNDEQLFAGTAEPGLYVPPGGL